MKRVLSCFTLLSVLFTRPEHRLIENEFRKMSIEKS